MYLLLLLLLLLFYFPNQFLSIFTYVMYKCVCMLAVEWPRISNIWYYKVYVWHTVFVERLEFCFYFLLNFSWSLCKWLVSLGAIMRRIFGWCFNKFAIQRSERKCTTFVCKCLAIFFANELAAISVYFHAMHLAPNIFGHLQIIKPICVSQNL